MPHNTPTLEQIIREAKTSKTAKVYQAIGEQGNHYLTQVYKRPGEKQLAIIHCCAPFAVETTSPT